MRSSRIAPSPSDSPLCGGCVTLSTPLVDSVNLRLARGVRIRGRMRAAALQEIEIATLIRLHHVHLMHRAVAARETRRRLDPRCLAAREFLVAHQQVEISSRNVY